MRLKNRSVRVALDMQQAEAIALEALGFLARDAKRLGQFMQVSGVSPTDLARVGDDPALLRGVLEYVLADESSLLVFTAETGHQPELVSEAHRLIGGSHGREWND